MASKVKALLSKKRIYTLFGRKFKDDDKVTNLLRKLAANQNDGKLWGGGIGNRPSCGSRSRSWRHFSTPKRRVIRPASTGRH